MTDASLKRSRTPDMKNKATVNDVLSAMTKRAISDAANQAVMLGRNLPKALPSDWPKFNDALSSERMRDGKS